MLMLAMDTSTSAVTVALHDGTKTLAETATTHRTAHAELLAPGIARVLGEAGATPADVTDVAVGLGPGPFTGLRVGIVTARVFGYARNVPVHGVCSLDALAYRHWQAGGRGTLTVATDARRKEVYWRGYRLTGDGVDPVTPAAVARAADLPTQWREAPTVGRGPGLYPQWLGAGIPPLDVDASALAALVVRQLREGADLSDLEPIYLRRPDAQPSVPGAAATAR